MFAILNVEVREGFPEAVTFELGPGGSEGAGHVVSEKEDSMQRRQPVQSPVCDANY